MQVLVIMKLFWRPFLSFLILVVSIQLSLVLSAYAAMLSLLILFIYPQKWIAALCILCFLWQFTNSLNQFEAHSPLIGQPFHGELRIDRVFSNGQKAFCVSDSLNQSFLLEVKKPLSQFKTYRAKGVFRSPKQLTNPSAFNQRDFCYQNGVYLELTVESIKEISAEQSAKAALFNHLDKITDQLSPSFRGILYAGLFGEKLYLPSDDRTLFAVSGLSHFFALSGLHVGLIVFVVWTILSQLTRRFWPRYIGIALFLISYILLVGLKPPIGRAAMMTMLYLYGHYQFRYMNGFGILWLTAFLNTVLFPMDIFQLSFWLSYLALFSILYGLRRYQKLNSIYAMDIQVSWASKLVKYAVVVLLPYVGTMPLIFLLFSNISLASMANNMLLILPLSLLLYGLMLFVFVSTFSIHAALTIGYFLDQCIGIMKQVMQYFSAIAPLENHGSFLWLMLSFLVLALLLHLRHKPIRRVLTAAVLLNVFFLTVQLYIHHNWLQIRVFDLGQAQAILISQGNWHMLYDAGRETRKRLWKKNELVPILRRVGVDSLNLVVISHQDYDHYGNLFELAYQAVENHPLEPDSVFPRKIEHKNLTLYHLEALREFRGTNSNSLVYKGVFGKMRFLLTGDIDEKRERELVHYYSDVLASDILFVPHHGSETSSSEAFISAVNPQLSVISVGERNRYGHPNQTILDRLNIAKIWRTDQDSYLHIISNGDRFWHVPALFERLFF